MAVSVDVSIDMREVDKELQSLIESAPRATSYSLNRAINSGKSRASELIRQKYTIMKSDLDATLRVKPSTSSDLRAKITVKSRPLALTKFIARWHRGQKVGAIVSIKKGSSATIPHTFIAKMPSGHVGVFERKGKARKPIRELKTISPVEMISSKGIRDDVQQHMITRFVKDLLAYLQLKGMR